MTHHFLSFYFALFLSMTSHDLMGQNILAFTRHYIHVQGKDKEKASEICVGIGETKVSA